MNAIDLNELDPGIRETVAWLRERGFNTTDSGDGVSKEGAGEADSGICDVPHVAMVCVSDRLVLEADRLVALLEHRGIDVVPQPPPGVEGVHVSAQYDPSDQSAMILLVGLNDAGLSKR